jgi:hypothetical protein
MDTYVELNATLDDLLDPAKNPGMRVVTIDQRDGATLESILIAIAADFPTSKYLPMKHLNWELFRDILAEWMLKNWETWLEVEVMLSERDCREQLTLLHDIAAAFHYALGSAIHERAGQGKFEGIANAHRELRIYVFKDG